MLTSSHLSVGDLDGNAIPDVLSFGTGNAIDPIKAELWWHSPTEGLIDLAVGLNELTYYEIRGSFVEDINGDGHLDVVITDLHSIWWSENVDGHGVFDSFEPLAIRIGSPFGVAESTAFRLADLDNDNDLDIVTLTPTLSDIDYEIAWLENTDGMGAFGPREVLATTKLDTGFLDTADMDGDGDLDIVTGIWEWFESDLIDAPDVIPGDANGDGATNFQDFLILANNFGKEDASFAEGDFDGDGRVSFLDFLVLAENFGAPG